MSQARTCSCPEPAAKRLDEPMHVHEGCLVYHTGAICALKEGTMAQSEEKELGSYVKSASVKVLDTGEAEATITITGTQKALERLIGSAVVLENGTKKMLGKMVAFSVVDKKGKREASAKVKGARDLDSLVGNVVMLSRAQKDLPGIES